MNRFILIFSFSLFALSSTEIYAQTVTTETQSNFSTCSQELFEKAENSFNRRKRGSETLGRTELELKEIVSNCAGSFWHYQAEEYLKIVQEEQAESNFVTARYYWNKFKNGKTTGLAGALSRLKIIIEKYPNYSKIDDVKLLLEEVNTENSK